MQEPAKRSIRYSAKDGFIVLQFAPELDAPVRTSKCVDDSDGTRLCAQHDAQSSRRLPPTSFEVPSKQFMNLHNSLDCARVLGHPNILDSRVLALEPRRL
jgi:hypothetical protein